MLRPVVARIRDRTNSHWASEKTMRRWRRRPVAGPRRLPFPAFLFASARFTAAAAAAPAMTGSGMSPPVVGGVSLARGTPLRPAISLLQRCSTLTLDPAAGHYTTGFVTKNTQFLLDNPPRFCSAVPGRQKTVLGNSPDSESAVHESGATFLEGSMNVRRQRAACYVAYAPSWVNYAQGWWLVWRVGPGWTVEIGPFERADGQIGLGSGEHIQVQLWENVPGGDVGAATSGGNRG